MRFQIKTNHLYHEKGYSKILKKGKTAINSRFDKLVASLRILVGNEATQPDKKFTSY